MFDRFKLRNQKSIGSLACIFLFTLLFGAINILVNNYQEGYEVLLKLMYTHLLCSLFMTMISYGLYYVLRENFDYTEPEMVSTKDKSLKELLEEDSVNIEEPIRKKKNYRRRGKTSNKTPNDKKKTSQKKGK